MRNRIWFPVAGRDDLREGHIKKSIRAGQMDVKTKNCKK